MQQNAPFSVAHEPPFYSKIKIELLRLLSKPKVLLNRVRLRVTSVARVVMLPPHAAPTLAFRA